MSLSLPPPNRQLAHFSLARPFKASSTITFCTSRPVGALKETCPSSPCKAPKKKMFGMQQLKAPFCFCCALALSSSLICIFLQGKNCFLLFVGVWMLLLGRNCGFYRWLGDVPPTLTSLCSSVQGPDQTRPAAQELSRRMVAFQLAQTAATPH